MNHPIMVRFKREEKWLAITTYEKRMDYTQIPCRPYCCKFGPFDFKNHDIITALDTKDAFIAHDYKSFLEVSVMGCRVKFQFTWLKSYGNILKGEEQTILLPIETVLLILQSDQQCHTVLSCQDYQKKNPIQFSSSKNLSAVAHNHIVRKKFQRFFPKFCDTWGHDFDSVKVLDDFLPFSFFFRCYRNGQQSICGGIILHGQEDLKKSYYEIHT